MWALSRLCVAALAGAVIAWVVTAFVLHATFAAGGYTRESLVELPPWAFGVVGGTGATMALVLAWAVGRSPLPAWVRPAVVGGLAGVALVVALTLGIAGSLGGPSSMGQAPYLRVGLVFGVPAGLVAGVWRGLLRARSEAEPFTAPDGDERS